jgi:hypothetical protein
VPTINDAAYNQLHSHGIDTVFYARGDFESNCKVLFSSVVNTVAPSHGFYFYTDPNGAQQANSSGLPYVSAILLGDETDNKLDNNLRLVAQQDESMAELYPSVLTYQVGHTVLVVLPVLCVVLLLLMSIITGT